MMKAVLKNEQNSEALLDYMKSLSGFGQLSVLETNYKHRPFHILFANNK